MLILMPKTSLYQKISIVLREVDPYKLIEVGAPSDEYDIEAAKIIKIIKEDDNSFDIAEKITQILEDSFESPLIKEKLEKILERLEQIKKHENN